MCGIYITNLNYSRNQIKKKLDRIKFRGPDNTGFHKANNISIAHLRLSIIDLDDRSNQPFEFNGNFLTYNGEIYNYKSIRKKLIDLGYEFNTSSDTEVLIKGYDYWGSKVVDQLNGMFSFAIYDSTNQLIFCARDRLGVKPFYYYFENGKFEISSQISCLKRKNYEIDKDAINAYLKTGYIPSPLSIYEKIKKLSPGNTLIIDLNHNKMKLNNYWNLKQNSFGISNYDESKKKIISILEDSVKIRLNSDVPIGTFLSGGVDSALISSIAAKYSKKRIQTFTVGFNEVEYDESKIAKQYSKIIGSKHKEFICSEEDLLKLVPKFIQIYDEPFSDPSAIPSLLLSSKVKEDVTVVLSGDGGDESFFGYNHFYFPKIINLIFMLPLFIRRVLSIFLPIKILAKILNKDSNTIKEILNLNSFKDYQKRIFISNPKYIESKKNTWLQDNFSFSKNIYQQIADLNIKLWLENDSNVKVDRASMAYSLEVRSPFLDYRLIEIARTIPVKYRLLRKNRKKLLKDILTEYIPRHVFDYPKKGFSIPLKDWTRGKLKKELINTLSSKNLSVIPGLNYKKFLKLMNSHFKSEIDFSLEIWRMYVLVSWYQKNKSEYK